jgi:APA family basic amino acid/polyamine antiporter
MTLSPSPPSATTPQLVRGLGLLDAAMIVAGSMIGSGIFIVSADIAREVGSAGLAAGDLGADRRAHDHRCAQLRRARRDDAPGGRPVRLPARGLRPARRAFSTAGRFSRDPDGHDRGGGGGVRQVPRRAPAAALRNAQVLAAVGRFKLTPATFVAIGLLLLLSWSNTTGLRTGKLIQNVFTFAKIAALLGLIGLGIFVGANAAAIKANFTDWWTGCLHHRDLRPRPPGTSVVTTLSLSTLGLLVALGTAMVGSLFSADAWNNVTFTAGEVKNPQRNSAAQPDPRRRRGVRALLPVRTSPISSPCHWPATPDAATVVGRGIQFATGTTAWPPRRWR